MRRKLLVFCIEKSDYYNRKDPAFHLISNFNIIEEILKTEDMQRLLEFFNANKKIIHKVLYNEERIINIKPNEKMSNLSCNIYLKLLINDDLEVINYCFPIKYINEINSKREAIINKYKKFLLSICIISLNPIIIITMIKQILKKWKMKIKK